MCGIFSLVNKNNASVTSEQLKPGLDIIKHRGPNAEGVFTDKNIGLGHRRLSIIDLDESSNQPFKGPDNLVLTYNGEIYNYIELRQELEGLGYIFKTKSDTEVLLASYHCWGEACQEKFNGMWAFVIYDPKKNILFASRDRFGIKPLYFSEVGDLFALASEIKQFTTLKNWKANLNHHLGLDYFYYGVIDHTSETLFQDVNQLKGGHSLIYNLNTHQYEISQWYNLKTRIIPFSGTTQEATKCYQELLEDAVNLRLRSDVTIGSSLSGGIDSSSIVSLIHKSRKNTAQNQYTVSACYNEKEYDERKFINILLQNKNINHFETFPSVNDLSNDLDSLIFAQDE